MDASATGGQPCDARREACMSSTRCQSLPASLANDSNNSNNCDTRRTNSADATAANNNNYQQELWFNTWPERCDKAREDMNWNIHMAKTAQLSTGKPCYTEDNYRNNVVSLDKALQNISLAYNPITKRLHIIEDEQDHAELKADDMYKSNGDSNCCDASSIASSASVGSSQSCTPCLKKDEEIAEALQRRRGLSGILTRGLHKASVWLLNGKMKPSNAPGLVVSSSALIQLDRPSTLPVKDVEELQRHREEYRAIVDAAKKRQAKETASRIKLERQQIQIELQISAHTRYWNRSVLPDWDNMSKKRKTLDLWWRGIPPSVRGRVWQLAIGNSLNVTEDDFLVHSAAAEAASSAGRLESILLDIARTFPYLGVFQEGGPYSAALRSLLAAYVCFRPDVGYVQGMSFIGAVFVLNMELPEAFFCFANLLEKPLLLAAFSLDESRMRAYCAAYAELFRRNLPRLFEHFDKCSLTPDLYLFDWLYTVFARAMPLDVACRVWDVFLRDGDEFIFRAALGVLHLHQEALLEMDFLHGAQFLTRLPEDLDADSLFKSIQCMQVTTSRQTFTQLLESCGQTFS